MKGQRGQKKLHSGITELPRGKVLVHPQKGGTTMEKDEAIEIRQNHRNVEQAEHNKEETNAL